MSRPLQSSVAFAVPDFDPSVGGTTRQTRLQAEAMRRRGHGVVVVTRRLRPEWPVRERIAGLDVVRLGGPSFDDGAALLSLAAWLTRQRRNVAVLQTVMWPDAVLAAAAAGLLRRTAVLWAIDGEITAALVERQSPRRKLQRTLRFRAYGRVEHVVLTERMAAELRSLAPTFSQRVIAVPVDRDYFRPPTDIERMQSRAGLGVPHDAFTVVYVGHLQRRKRVDRLISAFAALHRNVSRARLLLVGGSRGKPDDTEMELRALVSELGVDPAVSFCGVVPDPRSYLWASDVLALVSDREGLPNSLLEAMACGLPCVATFEAGGDLLYGDAGVVPTPAEPAEIARVLTELAVDPGRRVHIGQESYRQSERYDIERVADEYERLYTSISRSPG
jgi:glycosyltransferase involved in cell wall biosynthesis